MDTKTSRSHRCPTPHALTDIEHYTARGVDLQRAPLVGVGTVCRRQGTADGIAIIRSIAAVGIRVHAFGFKKIGLCAAADAIASADSLAWSYDARRRPAMSGHTHSNCANCPDWALRWYGQVIELLG